MLKREQVFKFEGYSGIIVWTAELADHPRWYADTRCEIFINSRQGFSLFSGVAHCCNGDAFSFLEGQTVSLDYALENADIDLCQYLFGFCAGVVVEDGWRK